MYKYHISRCCTFFSHFFFYFILFHYENVQEAVVLQTGLLYVSCVYKLEMPLQEYSSKHPKDSFVAKIKIIPFVWIGEQQLSLAEWIKMPCPLLKFSTCAHSQITWSRLLIPFHIFNAKQCRSRSVGFLRSQLSWIYTVCRARAYLGATGPG